MHLRPTQAEVSSPLALVDAVDARSPSIDRRGKHPGTDGNGQVLGLSRWHTRRFPLTEADELSRWCVLHGHSGLNLACPPGRPRIVPGWDRQTVPVPGIDRGR